MSARYRNASAAVIGLTVLFLIFSACAEAGSTGPEFRNVIVFVADGMGSAHTTVARWYKGGRLSLDRMDLGGVRTYASDSLITDSAAAATAFACGHKSASKLIGVMPGEAVIPGAPLPGFLKYKPVASVLEGARLSGRAIGIVATANVQHATPAAFSSHWPDRRDYNEIAEQQVYQDIDVVFGGGRKYLLPKDRGGARTDNEDLLAVLRSKGYAVVTDREGMFRTSSRKIWGLFADDAMAYEFDRRLLAPGEPGLAEMTARAIEVLSKNGKGFFLFVEGSKIDWASHANDPVGVISDVLAFDKAVEVALDFAGKKGRTLVVAFSDHGCGGMSLGSRRDRSRLKYEEVFGPLKKASLTGEGVEKVLEGDLSENAIRDAVAKYFGIDDLTREEVRAIRTSKKGDMNYALGPIVSRRGHIAWTTNGHTGEDLFFYSYGTGRSASLIENSDIAHMMANGMGFSLDAVDRRLFSAADDVFKAAGASLKIDDSDPGNKVLVIEKAGMRAEMPFSKNIMKVGERGERKYFLEGITVFSPKTGTVYVPRQAASVFMNQLQ